jgi:AcrR family transcriptional regulator
VSRTPTDARRPRSTRARPTDDELLDAALTVFADKGFQATTMSQIAERSNSSKPTLYAHFGDKDALYSRLLAREADTCRTMLFAAYAANADLGLRDQVTADTRALFDYVATHPHGFALLFGGDITSTVAEVREKVLADVRDQVVRRLHDYLKRRDAGATDRPPTSDEQQLAAMLVGVAVSAAQHAQATHGNLPRACALAAGFSNAALTHLEL